MTKIRTFGLVVALLALAGIAPVVAAAASCCSDPACCDLPCCNHGG